MKKLLWTGAKKLLLVGLIAGISIALYAKLKSPDVVYNEIVTTEELKGSVYTSEMAFEQSRQVGKLFGYEGMWNFTYKLDKTPEFIKKSTNENWFSDGAKSVGHFFLGKEYSIELNNYFMLGYDLSTLKENDVRYIEESQTLVIQLPKLELSYTPDYEETDFNSSIGLFRFNFSDEEKHNMYKDSIQLGIDTFIEEQTEELNKGREYTQQSIERLLLNLPDMSKHVKKVEFIQPSDEIITSIEEYKTATN